jgi:hypothetical protein
MVLAAELIPTSKESWAIVDNLPENIHVFVQVPTIKDARIEEPQIYWSTEAHIIDRGCIPPGSLKIRMRWETSSKWVQWESHHYEVASTVLKEHGFDPSTDSAALSLNLPLFEIPDPHDSSYQNGSGTFRLLNPDELAFIVIWQSPAGAGGSTPRIPTHYKKWIGKPG